ncbi:MAG: SRPBCC family protein [Saprospiraceae bacterium]
MKYLKYTLYFLIILIVIFFGMGIITPQVSYESEVTVDKSLEESWAVMSDESRVTEWLTDIKRMEHKSGIPNTVGAVSTIYVEDNGQEMMMEETITALEPNKRIAMTFTMDFMKMDYEMSLSQKEGKTLIKSNTTTVGNGMFAKSMLAFMPKAMKKQEDKNMHNLKKVIDENAKNYFQDTIQIISKDSIE